MCSYPTESYDTNYCFSKKHQSFLATVQREVEYTRFSEAVKHSKWRIAMQQEIDALKKNGTWKLTSLPAKKKALGCKWVYKIKLKSDSSIEHYKNRLVILGNTQVGGEDFTETFTPIAKLVTVRTLLTEVVAKGWEIHQMNVHNTFLHGNLAEEVYMKMPPGFGSISPTQVYILKKSLYGLRQALRC